MVARSAAVAAAVWTAGGSWILENLCDRGQGGSPRYQKKWRSHAPLWLMDEIKQLRRETSAEEVTYPQCALKG
eukprot:42637-Prymnesium_polylepis.1